VVEDAAGRTHALTVVPAEVDQEIAKAVELVAEFNDVARSGPGQIASLAKPSPDTCSHCPQRLACAPYWTNLKSDWRHGAVMGTIIGVSSQGSTSTVDLDIESPVDWARQRGSVFGLAESPESGCLAAVGTDFTPGERSYRARWDTTTSTMNRDCSGVRAMDPL
jgi:hypothetical protein